MRLALLIATLLIASLPLMTPERAQAEQYVSGGQVVHTRRLPVIAHRIVPPFRGVHVYGGRRR
jgi:hypothetical protein